MLSDNRGKHILVLTYWSFNEALIQSYTLPYVRIIKELIGASGRVTLVTFERNSNNQAKNSFSDIRNLLSSEKIDWIGFEYSRISIKTILKLIMLLPRLSYYIFKNKVSHIHGWCMPGGALGYLLSKFTLRPLIVDSYEPHSEASVENGDWSADSWMFKLLFSLEKRLTSHCKVAIAAASGMLSYAREKYDHEIARFYVKPACVDLELFNVPKKETEHLRSEHFEINDIVCVYAGKFGGIYLDTEVFDFFKSCADFWGDRFKVLLLTNQKDEHLQDWADKAGFETKRIVKKFVPHSEVPLWLAVSDFGITPVKSINTKKYCTPIKDGEYWATGLPVVITPEISDDSRIIQDYNIGVIWDYKNKESYQHSIKAMAGLLDENKELRVNRIRKIAEKYRSFSIARNIYNEIYLQNIL